MALEVITAPATDPVTTAECKTHSRISTSDDDALIALYITRAREYAEDFLERTLITTTYDVHLDGFFDRTYVTGGVVQVPRPPLQSVTSIKYLDDNGDQQTWSSSLYRVDTKSSPGRITPAYGETYPSTRGVTGDVIFRVVAGFGDASAVPETFKVGLKQLVGALYDFLRESHGRAFGAGASIRDMPWAGDLAFWPRRMMSF